MLEAVIQTHDQDRIVARLEIRDDADHLQGELLDPVLAEVGQAVGLHAGLDLVDADIAIGVPQRFVGQPRGRQRRQTDCRGRQATQGTTVSRIVSWVRVHPQHVRPFQK